MYSTDSSLDMINIPIPNVKILNMATSDFKQDYKLIVENYDKFKNLQYNTTMFISKRVT